MENLNEVNKEKELDFTNLTDVSREFIPGFGGLDRQEVEKIANTESVGPWVVDKFTTDEVDLMIAGAYKGREDEIPRRDELFTIAKILRARKAIEQ